MDIWPDFGTHAVWVWSAYGVTALILAGAAASSVRALNVLSSADAPDPREDAERVARAVRIDDA